MFPLPIHVLSRAVDWENPRVHQFSLSMRENLYMYSIFDAQHVYKFLRNLETRIAPNRVLPVVMKHYDIRTTGGCDYKILCGKPH